MQETIGQRLKREREARFLTLERASAETRIRTVFLQALEADDYSVMPSAAQGRGFLRNYAEYLNLDVDQMIAEIQRSAPLVEVSGPLPQVNLAETEIPPLTESQDEPRASFWTRLLPRRTQAESTLKVESAEPNPPDGDEIAAVEPTAENPPDAVESLPIPEEAKPNLLGRIKSIFSIRREKKEESISVDVPEPVMELPEEPARPIGPSQPADVILAEIGSQLRERRELISLTMEEVERHTRLRAVFVKALEDGAFDKLPSTVQTRGMLANYATFLDLDVDAILLRYADALQARRREKYTETPREKIQTQVNPSMPALRTFIAGDLVFGVVMITILVALAIWGVGRVVSLQEEQAQPTAPSIVDVLGEEPLPTPSAELTFVAADEPAVETQSAGGAEVPTAEEGTPGIAANVTVSVFALERVFVRISVDGAVVFEGRMAPRETKVFNAENQVDVLSGDGGALRITYNGRDLGLMGGPGQVISSVYTITGVVTPTATIPPTPTNTPPTTPTFTPTSTPTPTMTATPSQ